MAPLVGKWAMLALLGLLAVSHVQTAAARAVAKEDTEDASGLEDDADDTEETDGDEEGADKRVEFELCYMDTHGTGLEWVFCDPHGSRTCTEQKAANSDCTKVMTASCIVKASYDKKGSMSEDLEDCKPVDNAKAFAERKAMIAAKSAHAKSHGSGRGNFHASRPNFRSHRNRHY